ncbi:flagellar hook-basal body complex protein [Falsirhodobacter xinxiangensis]|uniref:flagellar hook-basal body complex protein n=1 Tax=Falsirhodobacter xinxiangensis TaxID=2530049 RepID=UPI0010AA7A17|nr:flagellar hook-basal body complex protein [Rhodobacter xinxiangensis]
MDYVALTRQSGLMKEMQVTAHNIANISTTGFRREGVIFAEHVKRTEGGESLSMAHASARHMDLSQAGITTTGAAFDFAIQGEGFFAVQTPDGERLTRAGSFTPSDAGELVNADGHLLLDIGGAPIFVPPDAGQVAVAQDGTVSANGQPIGQIGLFQPVDPLDLRHQGGTLFATQATEPVEGAVIFQGSLEESNVQPVAEIARMIEVQRAYELGQSFLDREDERLRGVIQTLGR